MVNKEYYEILEISENASKEEIKRAYKKLALEWHPDKKGNSEEANKKIREINEAFEVLNSESKSVAKYGYDYGEEIETGELAVSKYLNSLESMSEAWYQLHYFYADTDGFRTTQNKIVSDYHLIRAKNLLKVLDSYYKPKYLAANGEDNRSEVMKDFWWWQHGSGQSNQKVWKDNFERVKRMLNYARKALELPEFTDQDLQIEEKSPNETPQIPGEKPRKPIEDGVDDIEKYNKSFDKENNETVRKFWELRDKLYGTNENYLKFLRVNSTLFDEINSKTIETEKGIFRTIWVKDEATKVSEIRTSNNGKLNKMSEAIKLMEKIIQEGENNNSVSEPRGKKREAEIGVRNENVKKTKTVADDLNKLISESEGMNTSYEELEAKIKKIDEYQGEEAYNNRQEEINQLKIKLGGLDKDKFRQLSIQKIDDIMKNSKIKESDLTPEEKDDLAKLKNENDVNKINELENKVSEKIGNKGALNTLNGWLKQAKELVESAKKSTVKHLQEELEKVKKELYSFRHSTNAYQKSAYESKEKDVKEALEKLEKVSQNNAAQQPKSGFFQSKVLIPVALLAVVLAIAAVVVIRKRKQIKVKKIERL